MAAAAEGRSGAADAIVTEWGREIECGEARAEFVSRLLPMDRSGTTVPPARARFRELLGKVGSGEHTSVGLSREEAQEALTLMLLGEVDGAQMGAFLIAHRIRRPTPQELAGMLEAYRQIGPRLHTPGRRALCFGVPYDGRSRTAPLLPPLVRDGSQALPVEPYTALKVLEPKPNSGVLVLPMTMAPAAFIRATCRLSCAGKKLRCTRDPEVVTNPVA